MTRLAETRFELECVYLVLLLPVLIGLCVCRCRIFRAAGVLGAAGAGHRLIGSKRYIKEFESQSRITASVRTYGLQ